MSDLDKQFEAKSMEEIKKTVIDSFPTECKTVGHGFFSCVETHVNNFSSLGNSDYEAYSEKMSKVYVPQCMSTFNLEDCLNKYDK